MEEGLVLPLWGRKGRYRIILSHLLEGEVDGGQPYLTCWRERSTEDNLTSPAGGGGLLRITLLHLFGEVGEIYERWPYLTCAEEEGSKKSDLVLPVPRSRRRK